MSDASSMGAGDGRRVAAHALFYPAAAAHAAAVVPASVLAWLGVFAPMPGLLLPAGHAHELVFGFGLAAVAGHQLGRMPRAALAAVFGAWLAARVLFLAVPGHPAAALANALFAGLLAWRLVPRFAAAKKARNRALPATLASLCACAVAMQVTLNLGAAAVGHAVLVVAILLLALLMLFMGGRIIAPAAAGAAWRRGWILEARVQPRIEGAAIAAIALAAITAGPWPGLAGIAAAAGGVLAAVRLARWRMLRLGRRDLALLGVGYAWLAAGLLSVGAALVAGTHLTTALHVITVGAVGTLVLNVVAMGALRDAGRDPSRAWLPAAGTLLVALATLARAAAAFGMGEPRSLLIAAALAWTGAYSILLVILAKAALERRRNPAAGEARRAGAR